MTLSELTLRLREGGKLSESDCRPVVSDLLDPTIPDPLKADFLMTQMQSGLEESDLVGFATAILERAQSPGFSHQWSGRDLMDCCGTGGGGLNILNISTGIVFILAAAGIPIVKHGNRGVTKKSGSADVLEALGLKIDLDPPLLRESLQELGWGFVFAPHYHPSFKAIARVRKTLGEQGYRTIFNYLGPLLNPVRPNAQLLGVFHPQHLELYESALRRLGCAKRCIVYSEHPRLGPLGEGSLDETLRHHPVALESGWSQAATSEMREELSLSPLASTTGRARFEELFVRDAEESAARLESIFRGQTTHQGRGLLIANAALALTLHGMTSTVSGGVLLATELIDSKAAYRLLQRSRDWAKSKK